MNAKIKLGFCSADKKPDDVVIIPLTKEEAIKILEAGLHHTDSWFEILVDENND